MISVFLVGSKIYSNSMEAFSLFERSAFGEKVQGKVEYSPVEALFLLEEKKVEVIKDEKKISFDSLIKHFIKKDSKIESKLLVYSDLRKKGYVIKSALKFGADFMVYDKGIRPGKGHSRWLLSIAKESSKITPIELSAKVRVAHSTRKTLLLAMIDEGAHINYYNISWQRT